MDVAFATIVVNRAVHVVQAERVDVQEAAFAGYTEWVGVGDVDVLAELLRSGERQIAECAVKASVMDVVRGRRARSRHSSDEW